MDSLEEQFGILVTEAVHRTSGASHIALPKTRLKFHPQPQEALEDKDESGPKAAYKSEQVQGTGTGSIYVIDHEGTNYISE